MTHLVYALVDPHTHVVRYVGQTSKGALERLRHHLGAARRNVQKPVYDWIRSLGPKEPLIVILQEVEYARIKRADGVYESTSAAAEIKWMKRFERSRIFNSIDRSSGAYRRLVNDQTKSR